MLINAGKNFYGALIDSPGHTKSMYWCWLQQKQWK